MPSLGELKNETNEWIERGRWLFIPDIPFVFLCCDWLKCRHAERQGRNSLAVTRNKWRVVAVKRNKQGVRNLEIEQKVNGSHMSFREKGRIGNAFKDAEVAGTGNDESIFVLKPYRYCYLCTHCWEPLVTKNTRILTFQNVGEWQTENQHQEDK